MMKKNFRPGAIGALMDEYERATREYRFLVAAVPEESYTRIADSETEDQWCRSIQSVTSHVVGAGYSYANYIRQEFALEFAPPSHQLLAHAAAGAEIDKMLDYTSQALDGRWEMSDDEISAIKIQTKWGAIYDLEQLLEHAVVHVLRHRRQIERFLLKFEGETS